MTPAPEAITDARRNLRKRAASFAVLFFAMFTVKLGLSGMLTGPFPPALGYVIGLLTGAGLAFAVFNFLPMKPSIIICSLVAVPALVCALLVDSMPIRLALVASLPGMVLGAALVTPKSSISATTSAEL